MLIPNAISSLHQMCEMHLLWGSLLTSNHEADMVTKLGEYSHQVSSLAHNQTHVYSRDNITSQVSEGRQHKVYHGH